MFPFVHLFELVDNLLVGRCEIVLEQQPLECLVDLQRVVGFLQHQELEEVGLEILSLQEVNMELVLIRSEFQEVNVVLENRIFDTWSFQKVLF